VNCTISFKPSTRKALGKLARPIQIRLVEAVIEFVREASASGKIPKVPEK